MTNLQTPLPSFHVKGWVYSVANEKFTLGRALKQRREDSAGTTWAFNQEDVAAILGISQSSVSLIERDRGKLENRSPKQVMEIVKAYGFSDTEAGHLVAKFFAEYIERVKGDLPNVGYSTSDLEAGRVTRLEDVDLVTLRVVGDTTAGETLTVTTLTLQGVSSDSCLVVPTSGGVLACERVRAEYKKVSRFIFTSELHPRQGDMVLYQFKDTGEWLICLYADTPPTFAALAYDGSAAHIIHPDDPRLEFRGVHIAEVGTGRLSERTSS